MQFLKKQIHLEQISPVKTMSLVKKFLHSGNSQFFFAWVVVAMVILIISMTGGLAKWT